MSQNRMIPHLSAAIVFNTQKLTGIVETNWHK